MNTQIKYPVNTVLLTKDGRKIGNAIVIASKFDFNIIKTDYGNNRKLTDREIEDLFYIQEQTEQQKFNPHKHFVTQKTTNLTKQEAATALQQGKKVQHRSFRSSEFIYQAENKIFDETDKDVTTDFEVSGGYPMFDNGWSIYDK